MKKLFILTIVFILQLVFTTSFACDFKIADNSASSSTYSKIEKIDSVLEVKLQENSKEHSTDSKPFHCDHCEGCNHFVVSLNNFPIVQDYNFYSLNYFYNFIYSPPHISFLSKPPIFS